MEDYLYYNDLYIPLKGDKNKPKAMFDKEQYLLGIKVLGMM